MSVTTRESLTSRSQPGGSKARGSKPRGSKPATYSFGVNQRTRTELPPQTDSAVLRAFAVADLNYASWMCVSPDRDYFWVANHRDASIATYRFIDRDASQDNFELVAVTNVFNTHLPEQRVGQCAGQWVDLQLSEDGQLLYQLFEESGAMAVYEVDGHRLTLVEALTDERIM